MSAAHRRGRLTFTARCGCVRAPSRAGPRARASPVSFHCRTLLIAAGNPCPSPLNAHKTLEATDKSRDAQGSEAEKPRRETNSQQNLWHPPGTRKTKLGVLSHWEIGGLANTGAFRGDLCEAFLGRKGQLKLDHRSLSPKLRLKTSQFLLAEGKLNPASKNITIQ